MSFTKKDADSWINRLKTDCHRPIDVTIQLSRSGSKTTINTSIKKEDRSGYAFPMNRQFQNGSDAENYLLGMYDACQFKK